ncbi:MAG: hypothetical protein OXC13_11875 [Caldilineaceae bacterium]|nr:hypothetical protein [Caldilineaceae bacterium]
MERNETSHAKSAAFVLKKALPGAVSQLLVLSVVAVMGLTVWGGWYAWGSFQDWNRHVRNHPVTWQDGRLFTDLTLWDYMLAADDPTTYALIHIKFLLHVGHATGAVRHPESQRAFRQSLRMATLENDGSGLRWMRETMPAVMQRNDSSIANNLRTENLCVWMHKTFVTVRAHHRRYFWTVYEHWLAPGVDIPPNTICR